MPCKKTPTGRTKLAYWAIGDCTDSPLSTDATPLTFKPLGGVQSITVNRNSRTATSTNEATTYTETSVLGRDFDISVSCLNWGDEVLISSQDELADLVDAAEEAGETPVIWFMEVDKAKDKRTYFFVTPSNPTDSSEIEGNRTREFQFISQPTYDVANPTKQTEAGTGL